MKWCEREEPICAGTNKRKVSDEALRILKLEHGTGPVIRGYEMRSVKITADDIEIVEIPFLAVLGFPAGGIPLRKHAQLTNRNNDRTPIRRDL